MAYFGKKEGFFLLDSDRNCAIHKIPRKLSQVPVNLLCGDVSPKCRLGRNLAMGRIVVLGMKSPTNNATGQAFATA